MSSALVWPAEWVIVAGWTVIGGAMYASCHGTCGLADTKTIYMKQRFATAPNALSGRKAKVHVFSSVRDGKIAH
jgi:hypothetical protein